MSRSDAFVIWTFILAFFWAVASLYVIGLVAGVFRYKGKETAIHFKELQHFEEDSSRK